MMGGVRLVREVTKYGVMNLKIWYVLKIPSWKNVKSSKKNSCESAH